MPGNGVGDAAAGPAIPVGVGGVGHFFVFVPVGQQLDGHLEDGLLLHAGQADGARLHRLGPLGLLPQNKHRLAQGGGLLLEAARVGHHQVAPGHKVVHLPHVQRGNQVDAGVVVQIFVGRLLNHGGEMDGVDQLRLREGVGQAAQGGHDVGHGLAVILPPVAGDEDHLPIAIIKPVQNLRAKGEILYNGGLEGVNHGVARQKDPFDDVLPGQIVPVGGGGAEVEVGNGAHQLPVDLLGEGGPLVIGAQPRLHVAHGDLVVEGGQRPGKGGGGVAVDQHKVGPGLLQHPVHAIEALGGDGGQGLPGLHDIQVVVGFQGKNIQY